jgi:aspartate aminotransferase
MSIITANRLQHIQPSATLQVSARANELKSQGKDIINLTVGEPDFDTPENIKAAACSAIQDGFTKYTAVDGIKSLKSAICNKLLHENNLIYDLHETIVSNGAKQAFYNLAQALLNPGDEVIIPAPYWVSYPEIVQLAEATPVIISTTIEQQFKITAQQLQAAITPNTRLFIINSPNNPTGITYSKTELQQLAEVLLKYPQIIIATDDMYEHILWNKMPFQNILNVCSQLRERVVVINGVSKAYAMTGWRIGYAAGPHQIINGMLTVQSQSTSNPNSIAQVAAQAALEGDQHSVQQMCQRYQERYEYFFAQLKTIPWLQCIPSDGTFYIFAKINYANLKSKVQTDIAVAEELLNRVGIAVVPGSAFGTPDHLRFSFATSDKILHSAIERLKNFS